MSFLDRTEETEQSVEILLGQTIQFLDDEFAFAHDCLAIPIVRHSRHRCVKFVASDLAEFALDMPVDLLVIATERCFHSGHQLLKTRNRGPFRKIRLVIPLRPGMYLVHDEVHADQRWWVVTSRPISWAMSSRLLICYPPPILRHFLPDRMPQATPLDDRESDELTDLGTEYRTIAECGRAGKKNGELLLLAGDRLVCAEGSHR